jgi:hypothetical protein
MSVALRDVEIVGAFALTEPLRVAAGTNPLTPVGSLRAPAPLVSYPAPVSNDTTALRFAQPIGASEPLRTGSYSKSLVLTSRPPRHSASRPGARHAAPGPTSQNPPSQDPHVASHTA